MAENLVVYTVVHQPRRLRLPARVIPPGTPPDEFGSFLFDEAMDRRYFEKVAEYSYMPATAMFRDLTKRGWRVPVEGPLGPGWHNLETSVRGTDLTPLTPRLVALASR